MSTASAPSKIILTGEYAVVFGFPGIAIPSPLKMEVTFEEDRTIQGVETTWEGIRGDENWNNYLQDIINYIQKFRGGLLQGKLTIKNQLSLGKGMGSSTSLVIAVSKCLLGSDCRTEALAIEDKVNPGHSGIDFNVIWEERPLLFEKGKEPQPIDLPENILESSVLIDTGKPNETTAELVASVRERENEVIDALQQIGNCTERLLAGEPLGQILPDHHHAQVALGVIPEQVQKLIANIENAGGSAKVLGAGARSGGGGMVLAIHENPGKIEEIALSHKLQSLPLSE